GGVGFRGGIGVKAMIMRVSEIRLIWWVSTACVVILGLLVYASERGWTPHRVHRTVSNDLPKGANRQQIEAWSQIKYQPMRPPAALPIEIVGHQFEWRIRYPSSRRLQSNSQLMENFAKESHADQEQADELHIVNELHLWKGGRVQIHLKSADVPHSFFLPLVRLKQDAIPGKVTDVWLEALHSNVKW